VIAVLTCACCRREAKASAGRAVSLIVPQ